MIVSIKVQPFGDFVNDAGAVESAEVAAIARAAEVTEIDRLAELSEMAGMREMIGMNMLIGSTVIKEMFRYGKAGITKTVSRAETVGFIWMFGIVGLLGGTIMVEIS
jgi:hypothetical protein